ncbi:flagellar protein FliT [Polaromonas sp. AER18D-145]|uniref:flagellar protein FliT n=1 Tax=Polaromonas sp. AER18D-145 TaxID=1977060 RepID=UPI0014825546|nr:flagellar protein FliT [Polaromonas sp. AER18D-145]
MGSQSEVMHCYEQIAPLTERMLLLARTKQWGALPALEAQYSGMVDRLKVIEPLETLDEVQAARKYQLLSRITANSTEIFGMVMPQLTKLVTLMQSLEQQQSLQRTYGQGGALS